jgi:hypothetical protein
MLHKQLDMPPAAAKSLSDMKAFFKASGQEADQQSKLGC